MVRHARTEAEEHASPRAQDRSRLLGEHDRHVEDRARRAASGAVSTSSIQAPNEPSQVAIHASMRVGGGTLRPLRVLLSTAVGSYPSVRPAKRG